MALLTEPPGKVITGVWKHGESPLRKAGKTGNPAKNKKEKKKKKSVCQLMGKQFVILFSDYIALINAPTPSDHRHEDRGFPLVQEKRCHS